DMGMPSGSQVTIEQRPEAEVLELSGQRIAADGATAWNPAFDVTPAALVDYFVTEAGVIAAPDTAKLAAFHPGLPSA
ncbi:MAG: S-methyl-5-thioribose-1-phosphate isomerase, partial [Gammaproteobacteria bacterium]